MKRILKIGALLAVVAVAIPGMGRACDCPTSADVAEFWVGTPVYVGLNDDDDATYDVPVYVSTIENIVYTQMTLKYNDNLIYYESGHPGDDAENAGFDFEDEVVNGSNSYIRVNFEGDYTGCDQHAYTFQFARRGGTGASLQWNTTDNGSSSFCLLEWVNGGQGGDITPNSICFENGSIPNQTGCTYPCWCDCEVKALAVERSTWAAAKAIYR